MDNRYFVELVLLHVDYGRFYIDIGWGGDQYWDKLAKAVDNTCAKVKPEHNIKSLSQ